MAVSDALILDIQRMSTEDGPGLRTTVFFKGCNLACPWCHNPESIAAKPDLNWFPRKCMACAICQAACPQKGISRNGGGVAFNRPLCTACGSCAKECPCNAIELKGKSISVESLAAELLKDKAYFGKAGGITLSGGEVMLQHKAAMVLARLLKEEGLHVAVDTAGSYDFSILEEMLPYTDLVLYDIKIFDNDIHKHILKTGNKRILENFKRLMEAKAKVWLRTPVIKGATGSGENIAAIGEYVAAIGRETKALPEKWELCAFNNLCRDKYERLDLGWAYKDEGLNEKALMEKLTEIAARYVPGAVYTGEVQ